MALTIEFDWKDLEKSLTNVERKQIPFAAALTATSLARRVAKAEVEAEVKTFDKPTAFTKNAFAVIPARKDTQVATLFAKDKQAEYLKPFLEGGKQVLGVKRGILRPANLKLDSFGNIPRGKIASLKADPRVFVGPVRFKGGEVINGVWERGDRGERRKGGYGTKGANTHNRAMGLSIKTTLTLLVRFTDPVDVKQRLPYSQTAQVIVAKYGQAEAEIALAKAIATMR